MGGYVADIKKYLLAIVLFLICTSLMAKPFKLKMNQGRVLSNHLNHSKISTAFIADSSIANFHIDKHHNIYLYGKKVGVTNFHIIDKKGKVFKKMSIQVTNGTSLLKSNLERIFPKNRVEVISVGEKSVALKGLVTSAAQADKIILVAQKYLTDQKEVINLLTVKSPTQVNLRVEIVEMVRSVNRDYGLDWFLKAGGSGLVAKLPSSSALAANPLVKGFQLSGSANIGNIGIGFVLKMLEENNLITILARPNLTALSGETASFLAGGKFPVLLPQQNINSVATIQYEKYGVSLNFSPTILENGRINIKIKSEVSEIALNSSQGAITLAGFNIPAITSRQTDTTVELNSGQSFALSGLLQNNSRKAITQFPGLLNLPILGALFRSQNFQRQETELMMIVTPFLVRPSGQGDTAKDMLAVSKYSSPANRAATARHLDSVDKTNIGFILMGA